MELSFLIGAHLGGPVAEEQQRLLEERNTYSFAERVICSITQENSWLELL